MRVLYIAFAFYFCWREYLVNLTRTCYQNAATSSSCSGLPSIAQISSKNFVIMGLPRDAINYRDYDFYSVSQSAVKCALQVAPTTPISCSSILPTFNAADQSCRSVISKISFRFAHRAGQILDYQIKLWTQDIVTKGFAFSVEIVFFENEIVDLTETAFPPGVQRSGADGYDWGRPLLAGRLSDQNSIQMTPFPLLTEADRQSGRGALYAWWVYPSGGDDCSDNSDPNRISFVRFGIDSYSACTLSECANIIVGQHIHIVYAYQGNVTQPRTTVLGAQIEYIRGNIKFLCMGAYCSPRQANRLQFTQISTQVSFFDATGDSTNRDISSVEYHYPSVNAWFPFYTYV